MKYIIILVFYLYYIKCENNFLDYYINYTFISPSPTQNNTFYFYPHYEVGTVNFIIFFLNQNFHVNSMFIMEKL